MTSGARPTVVDVATVLMSRPPLLGAGRLVCVDGRSGSGKTTLAHALGDSDHGRAGGPGTVLLRMDAFYAGWDGLLGTPERVVEQLLAPLAAGRRARALPWDWHTGDWSPDPVVVAPPAAGQLVVLDGVGAGARCCAAYASAVVWCEAPEPVRRARALGRDDDFGAGAAAEAQWEQWAAQEDLLLTRERTDERADLFWTSAT